MSKKRDTDLALWLMLQDSIVKAAYTTADRVQRAIVAATDFPPDDGETLVVVGLVDANLDGEQLTGWHKWRASCAVRIYTRDDSETETLQDSAADTIAASVFATLMAKRTGGTYTKQVGTGTIDCPWYSIENVSLNPASFGQGDGNSEFVVFDVLYQTSYGSA